MGDADPTEDAAEQAGGFDSRLERLEKIVAALEEGGLDLEDSIERYKEGVELLKGCREILGRFQRQVEELTRDADAGLAAYAGDPDVKRGERAGVNEGDR